MRTDGQNGSGGPGKQPLAERAYEAIREQILTGQLAPGTMVMAVKLAKQLGMSQTPVHEALKLLCTERLAYVIPRTGYVIAPVTVNDVQEIFQLRLALEPLAVELGMRRATDESLAAFREEISAGVGTRRRRHSSEGPGIITRAADAHDQFHLAVASLSGHGRLVAAIRDLLCQGRRLTFVAAAGLSRRPDPGFPEGAHRKIADAVLARDTGTAVEAVTAHVLSAHAQVVASMAALPARRAAVLGLPACLLSGPAVVRDLRD